MLRDSFALFRISARTLRRGQLYSAPFSSYSRSEKESTAPASTMPRFCGAPLVACAVALLALCVLPSSEGSVVVRTSTP